MSNNPKRWIGSLCVIAGAISLMFAQSPIEDSVLFIAMVACVFPCIAGCGAETARNKKHSQFPSGTRGIPTTRCLPHFGLRLPHLLPRAVVAAMMANIVAAIVAAIMAAIVPAIAMTSWLSDVSCLRQPSMPVDEKTVDEIISVAPRLADANLDKVTCVAIFVRRRVFRQPAILYIFMRLSNITMRARHCATFAHINLVTTTARPATVLTLLDNSVRRRKTLRLRTTEI